MRRIVRTRSVFRACLVLACTLACPGATAKLATPVPLVDASDRPRCVAGPGVPAGPRSIEAVVARIDALPMPMPVSLPFSRIANGNGTTGPRFCHQR